MHGSVKEARRLSGGEAGHLVLRNTLYLTIAQALTVPLSILMNAFAAQYLGAEAFGYMFLAATLCGFGYLVVGWGHDAALPATVAHDHEAAGVLLGTSLVWRALSSLVIYGAFVLLCRALGYPTEMQWALALTSLLFSFTYFIAGCKDTIRGLERTDIPAYTHVAQQLLATLLVCATLVLGGKLRAALIAQSVAGVIILAAQWPALRHVGVRRLRVQSSVFRQLFVTGAPFMLLSLAMMLQPNIDAVFLSKLAPPEVMGWFAVSRRLLGALLLPASALIGALYPTLCRLHTHDKDGFNRATNGALRSIALLIAPVALGCAFFPQLGVSLFSRQMFRPAEDNLRVMAAFIPLVYLSMPLGTAIMAAGRQGAWSLVQCLAVVISIVLDPLLVPIFQSRYGNGGLGLGVAAVISEVVMVGFSLALLPKGILDRQLARLSGALSLSALAFVATVWICRGLPAVIGAVAACVAYAVGLWLTGAVDAQQLRTIAGALGRKLPATPEPAPELL
jgi:O-antigen/teichoic acid export membrane protein